MVKIFLQSFEGLQNIGAFKGIYSYLMPIGILFK